MSPSGIEAGSQLREGPFLFALPWGGHKLGRLRLFVRWLWGVLSSVDYWVGGIHRDPISEEYHRPCCLGTGFLLGSLIGKAFNGVVRIHGEKENCFDFFAPGEEGMGKVLMVERNGACSGRLRRAGRGAPLELASRLLSAAAV